MHHYEIQCNIIQYSTVKQDKYLGTMQTIGFETVSLPTQHHTFHKQ
jgi:hypothetical protein